MTPLIITAVFFGSLILIGASAYCIGRSDSYEHVARICKQKPTLGTNGILDSAAFDRWYDSCQWDREDRRLIAHAAWEAARKEW